MLKKLVKLLVCQKTKKFSGTKYFAKSDRGKFYRTYPAYISFSPLSPIREKNTLYDYLRFYHIPTVILIVFTFLFYTRSFLNDQTEGSTQNPLNIWEKDRKFCKNPLKFL